MLKSPQIHMRCLLSGRADISSDPVAHVPNNDTAQNQEGFPGIVGQFLPLINVHDTPWVSEEKSALWDNHCPSHFPLPRVSFT